MQTTYGTAVLSPPDGKTTNLFAVPTISKFVEDTENGTQAGATATTTTTAAAKVSMVAQHGRTFLAVVSAALGAMTLGCTIGWTSPAVPSMESTMAFNLTAGDVAWVASVISLGGLLGEPFGGASIDRFGRRATLLMAAVPFAAGWLLIGCSRSLAALLAGRFVTGLCSGVMDVAVPVYIAEISDKSVRGFMGSCHELFTNVGYLFAFVVGVFLPWNWLAIACATLPAVMLLAMACMPESPRWLLARGRRDECVAALAWLRGGGGDVNVDVSQEVQAIDDTVRESGVTMEWRELFRPAILKPLSIVVALMFCQQFSGYGAIPEFLVAIFRSAGVVWNPYALTAVVGVAGVVANLASALLVDRAGRRVMLMVSAAVMLLSVAAMAAFFTAIAAVALDAQTHQWMPTVALCAYNFGVALGYGPIPFYMASELFPLRARGKAGGVGVSSVWLFMFLTSFAFPHMTEAMPMHVVYWILSGFSAVGVFVAAVFVPETKGRSLEAIELAFKGK